jgi:hypothetical protein
MAWIKFRRTADFQANVETTGSHRTRCKLLLAMYIPVGSRENNSRDTQLLDRTLHGIS